MYLLKQLAADVQNFFTFYDGVLSAGNNAWCTSVKNDNQLPK